MAEAALFGIAQSVLQQLASPALDEFRLLWGHREQFEKLEDTVTTIRNVLQDAERRQSTDAAVQGWLVRLKAALYEADDLFDAISAKVLLEKEKKGTEIGKKVRHFVSKPYRFAFLVQNAHKVKQIRESFDDIARDIKGFNFLPNQTDLDATSSRIGREPTHSYVPRNEVVGREQETEDLVRMLLLDSSHRQKGVSVIAVIGIGGLGKTTLAKLVYNDERVQKGFDFCMWACINYFSDLKQVLITLLKSATKSKPDDLDIDQLQSMFRKEIEGKRFLLVLDDVWDEDPQNWRELKHLLSSGRDGSKILTTTRSEIVAQCLHAMKPYFHLKGISDENAWLLFKKVAFGEKGGQISSEFEQLGQQIVRKCANVPLAIITIASLLREKEKERWLPLVNDELSKVFPDEYKKIMHVLEFSYKELPYSVKRCFGYCSLFPKDCKFNKDRLFGLWIAQGFVEPLGNESLEDKAEEYLLYLVKRCFFQPLGNVSYQIHDLMHDLATAVGGYECILVDKTVPGSWDKTVRHMSLYYPSKSMVNNVCSFSYSKSLRTFHQNRGISLGNNDLKKLMSCFRSLRVLCLSFLRIKKVPNSIGELIHLRFLDLSGNDMERLPSSICCLRHLQSLILRFCRYLKELPKDLGDLLSLRLLDLSVNDIKRLPSSICSLRHLHSLILQEHKHLKEFPDDLRDFLSLRLLDLSENNMEWLPSSICSLPHLKSLILRKCTALKELPEDLGDLLSLRVLDLSECCSMERLPRSICSLCHLQSLILRQCIALKELPEELGDLVSLRRLILQDCISLVKMPPGLAALTSLVTLDKLVVHNHSGGLRYLEGLDNLTGSLKIVLPSAGWEGSKTDAERSFLSRKSGLRALDIIHETLRWLHDDETANTAMNALQPPPNIVDLCIGYFLGKEMSHWVSGLHKLVILKLVGCRRCTELPPLSVLPSLKELDISEMFSLVAIENHMFYKPGLFFPSLETLSLKGMVSLKRWWMQAPVVLPAFPRLTTVTISDCVQLTRCIPVFPLVENLHLERVDEEIIWHVIGGEVISSSSQGNNVLKNLELRAIRHLHSISEAQIRRLSALQKLHISKCISWLHVHWNGSIYNIESEDVEFKWTSGEVELEWVRSGSYTWMGRRFPLYRPAEFM